MYSLKVGIGIDFTIPCDYRLYLDCSVSCCSHKILHRSVCNTVVYKCYNLTQLFSPIFGENGGYI